MAVPSLVGPSFDNQYSESKDDIEHSTIHDHRNDFTNINKRLWIHPYVSQPVEA